MELEEFSAMTRKVTLQIYEHIDFHFDLEDRIMVHVVMSSLGRILGSLTSSLDLSPKEFSELLDNLKKDYAINAEKISEKMKNDH